MKWDLLLATAVLLGCSSGSLPLPPGVTDVASSFEQTIYCDGLRSIAILQSPTSTVERPTGVALVDSPDAIRGATLGWLHRAWTPVSHPASYVVTIHLNEGASKALAKATANTGAVVLSSWLVVVRGDQLLYEVLIAGPISSSDLRFEKHATADRPFEQFVATELARLCP